MVVFVAALALANRASNLDRSGVAAAGLAGPAVDAWVGWASAAVGACAGAVAAALAGGCVAAGCAAWVGAGGLAGAHPARLNTNRTSAEIQRDVDPDTRQLPADLLTTQDRGVMLLGGPGSGQSICFGTKHAPSARRGADRRRGSLTLQDDLLPAPRGLVDGQADLQGRLAPASIVHNRRPI